jgi:hypothetical protein
LDVSEEVNMRCIPRSIHVAALGCALSAVAPRRSAAQTDAQIAAMGCRNAASSQLRSQRPGAEPSFTSAPKIVKRKRGEVQMRGEGLFLVGGRQSRRFVYDCTYRPHSAKTAVTLTFPDTTAKPRD